jgi:hypothetical protein
MSLERILAENMLRFGVKNLSDSDVNTVLVKSSHNIYSDYTYINEWGELVETADLKLMLENQLNEQDPDEPEENDSGVISRQTGLRRVASKVRRAIQRTPLMTKWQAWNQKKWLKRKGLPSRSVFEENDSDEVRNTPGYKEIVDLLYGKRTRDEGSILYWYGIDVLGGQADPEASSQMSAVIDRMNQLNGASIKSTKDGSQDITLDLSGFIAKLEEMQKQNVYVTGADLITIFDTEASPALNELFSAIATGKNADGDYTYNLSSPAVITDIAENYNNSFDPYQADAFYDAMAVDLKRLQNFATKLVLATGGGEVGTFSTSMQDKDKLAMIPRVLARHQENLQTNPKLTWQDYTAFYIAPNEATIKANLIKLTKTDAGGEQEAFASYYSYPDNPNDPAAKDAIYGNSDNETTWKNTSEFEAEMKRRIDAIVSNGGEIYRIEYNAGARSSAVGTLFGGLDPNASMAQKTEANVNLCAKRAEGITTGMKPIIDKLLPNLEEGAKALQKPNLHPNRGPGWYDYNLTGTADANGKTWGKGYGPIFTELVNRLGGYEKAKKARGSKYVANPSRFYICRRDAAAYAELKKYFEETSGPGSVNAGMKIPTQADIQNEYEATFGPHRGTYAGYVLFYTMKEKPVPKPEEEIDAKIETAGTWSFTLNYDVYTWGDFKRVIKSRWKRFKRKIKKFRLPKLKLLPGGGVAENLVHICDAYN